MKYNAFGLRGHDIADNFEDMCRLAEQAGIRNLQFAMAKTMQEIDFDEIGYDADLAQQVKKKLAEHQLSVSVLGCYIHPVHPEEEVLQTQLARFRAFIHYAKDLEARVIGTETGFVQDLNYTHSEENYQNFLKNVRPLVKLAEEVGVTIGIEPVWANTIYTVEVMKRLLEDIPSENLAVILDVSNLMHPENLKEQKQMITKAFTLFGERIYAVHVKDFRFTDGKKDFAVAGTGELEIEHLFRHINALSHTPEIILDEMKLQYYPEGKERLEALLQNL